MPKAQIPAGYSKAEVLGEYGPTTWANVLYFDTVVSDPTHPTDAMAAVKLAVHNLYNIFPSGAPTTWSIPTVRVTYRADETSIYTTRIADGMAGTVSAGSQDAQVAALINWISGDARKGGKPRQYIPGILDSHVADAARLDATYIANVNTAIAAWLAGFPYIVGTGHVGGLVEMSFRNAKAWRPTPIATPIHGGTLNPVVATQRRRVDRLRI